MLDEPPHIRPIMRELLVAVLVLSFTLPGCLERVNDSVNPEQKLFEDTIFVDEDGHIKLTWTIESPANIKINLEKLDGPNIDLYTMSELNYEDYKSCAEDGEGSFNYYSDLSDENTAGTNIEVTVDSGTYVTVIDNTDCGEAKPPDQGSTIPPQSDTNDRSRVQYTITAQ